MSNITVYGIPNCDTVKRARSWLEKHNIDYQFHDFRRDGLTDKQIQSWLKQVDMEVLLNKRSRTWRELRDQDKLNITDARATRLILKQPSLIKRPVLVSGKTVMVGFDPEQYQTMFAS